MIKKEFHYKDFNGEEKTQEAYFHLNKNDCIDMNYEFQDEGGLIEYVKKLVKESQEHPDDPPKKDFIRFVRLLITKAYGIRPKRDPGLFLKEDEYGRPLVQSFKGTPAYDDFVFDLLTGKEDLAEFTNGIMPQMDETQKAEAEKMLEAEGLGGVLHEV